MKITLRQRSIISPLLAVLLTLLTSADAEAVSKERFVWKNETGEKEIEVLLLEDRNDRGLVTMMFFALPAENRLVFYEIVDAKAGKTWERLEHDSIDWWLEYGDDMHGTFETSRDFFDYIFEINPPTREVEKRVTTFLRSEFFRYDQTYDYEPRNAGKLAEKFRSAALEEETCIELVESFPDNVRKGIVLLSRFDNQIKYRYQDFIDFLVRLLERAGFKSNLEQEEFVFERVGYEWGLGTMVTPEELEFTSRFESIDNADPFAGFRPEELFPEE